MVESQSPSRHFSPGTFPEDTHLVQALRQGDEAAFESLVDRYHASMLRLALLNNPDLETAADVVQEAWMGVLKGLQRFEGRSSLKTWIFRILTNCAKTRAQREGRSIPFSALWDPDSDPDEPAFDAARFRPPGTPRYPGGWVSLPKGWESVPESHWLSLETRAVIDRAIEGLPPGQRAVITLRDIEGWTPEETCSTLGITESNHRVLLHRARSRVRRALEEYLNMDEGNLPA